MHARHHQGIGRASIIGNGIMISWIIKFIIEVFSSECSSGWVINMEEMGHVLWIGEMFIDFINEMVEHVHVFLYVLESDDSV